MASCSAVITSALKKLGVSSPSSTELGDGLLHLQGLYDALVNGGAFGRLRDVVITSDYTACERDRIFVNTTSAATVTIPDTYSRAGATPWPYECEDVPTSGADQDVRPARDMSVIVVTTIEDGQRPQIWIRDAYQGNWVRIDDLALTDEAPLSGRDYDGFACYLATILADEYSDRDVNPRTALGAAKFLSVISHKGGSPKLSVAVDFF